MVKMVKKLFSLIRTNARFKIAVFVSLYKPFFVLMGIFKGHFIGKFLLLNFYYWDLTFALV